jgi:hypothetical protein
MINTVEVQDDSNFENHYAHTQSIIFGQSLLLSFAFSYWKKQPSAELFLSFFLFPLLSFFKIAINNPQIFAQILMSMTAPQ